MMAALAPALFVLYAALAFGLTTILQYRRSGSSSFKGVSGRPGSPKWTGGVLFVAALALLLAAPALQRAGAISPISLLDDRLWRVPGILLFGVGLVATLLSQAAMGSSWRIGVDLDERTSLVTSGLFALVRNPIFSSMFAASLGLVLLTPNLFGLAGFAALITAMEMQVRLVEEPYLISSHGDDYLKYASHVGRFVPGVGKLKA